MDQLHTQLAEIEQLAASADTLSEAVRRSGELLAHADGVWSALQREKKERRQQLHDVLECGIAHVDCLFRANAPGDAFATAVMLQVHPIVDDATTDCCVELMALNALAYLSLMAVMNNMEDAPATREHVATLARYICSMLYGAYSQVTATDAGELRSLPGATRWLPLAHDILEDAIHARLVQWPEVTVAGQDTNYLQDPGTVVGDVISRAHALGLISE